MSYPSGSQDWRSFSGDDEKTLVAGKRFERDTNFNFIFKTVKTSETIRDIGQAVRIATAMIACKKKEDILFLFMSNDYGSELLLKVLSVCENAEGTQNVIIPIFQFLLHEDLSRPLFELAKTAIMNEILKDSYISELVKKTFSQVSESSRDVICQFLLHASLQSFQARRSAFVRSMAQMCRASKCLASEKLASVLHFEQEDGSNEEHCPEYMGFELLQITKESPGGRHRNDRVNFRDISVSPTADELLCDKMPYIPREDQKNRFIAKENEVHYYLDKYFRLLREDALHPARENAVTQNMLTGLRFVGHEPEMRGSKLPSIVFRFSPPDEKLLSGTKSEQRERWERFRSLEQSALVAIFRESKPIGCGVIADSDIERRLMGQGGPYVAICFEDASFEEIVDILKCSTSDSYGLVTLSRSYFAYAPVLRRLQRVDSIPFESELLKGVPATTKPEYLRNPVVRLPELCGSLSVDLSSEENCREVCSEIASTTTLDQAQADALLHCLRSRVAVCQGPPGTGKTFLGVLLVQTILQNTGAKILCVCLTNHALDSFLLDILRTRVTENLVRIGGRSKVEEMQKYSLFTLSREKSEWPRTFKRVHGQCKKKMSDRSDEIRKATEAMLESADLEILQPYLQEKLGDTFTRCFGVQDDDEFVEVGKNGKQLTSRDLLKDWINGKARVLNRQETTEVPSGSPEEKAGPPADDSLWELDVNSRKTLMDEWLDEIFLPEREMIARSYMSLLRTKLELSCIRKEQDIGAIKSAEVVGATTTGAAIHADILRQFEADVIIVEEAGEVLEPHIIASLGEHAKHLILIGDHMQLRPKVACYELTEESGSGYSLDISLFERLVRTAAVPFKTLQVQHRMRPEVSQLVRLKTYTSLIDAEKVSMLDSCKGLTQDVFFINHPNFENEEHSTTSYDAGVSHKSKKNTFEAELAVEVVRYILSQGQFVPRDIVILTPYIGQVRLVMSLLRERLDEVTALISDADLKQLESLPGLEKFEPVAATTKATTDTIRVATVDNFQGEESAVVICSLVRSNERGSVGFLSQYQRVNVLASRARNVLVMIGNKETLLKSEEGSKVWRPILELLEDQGRILTGLPMQCQNHPDCKRTVSKPGNILQMAPNGGCTMKCMARMECGHVCPLACHPIDVDHKRLKCSEPCRRFPMGCPMEHPCPKQCHESCGPCTTPVQVVLDRCGHEITVECHIASAAENLSNYKCVAFINHVGKCGHQVSINCHETWDREPLCTWTCNASLECGHTCKGKCGDCTEVYGHRMCSSVCLQTMHCGHLCPLVCHSETSSSCGSCSEKCEVRCEHSQCAKLCGEVCSSCLEECEWQCKHMGQCPVPCGAPCTRLPCDMRCERVLECGHQCPGVCGEECPGKIFCHLCGEKGNEVVDLSTKEMYKDVDIERSRMIFLQCGHFFTVLMMDLWMCIEDVYVKEGQEWKMPITSQSPKPRGCPACSAVVRSPRRYGRVIRNYDLYVLELNFLEEAQRNLREIRKETSSDVKKMRLMNMVELLKRGPTRKIYEACGGSRSSVAIALPRLPNELIISAIEDLLAVCTDLVLFEAQVTETCNSGNKDTKRRNMLYREFKAAFDEGIALADETSSIPTRAKLRLLFLEFNVALRQMMDTRSALPSESEKSFFDSNAQWIIHHQSVDVSPIMKTTAERLNLAFKRG